MEDEKKSSWDTFTERVEVSGQNLLEEVNRLVREGNVRNLRISSADGQVFVDLPLTAGAVVGGVAVLAAPWLVLLGAIAGLASRVQIEIVRRTDEVDPPAVAGDEASSGVGDEPPSDRPGF